MKRLAVDTETTGLNVWTGARPYAVSAYADTGESFYWEVLVNPITRRPRWSPRALREVRDLLGDPSVRKLFWNSKFDLFMLEAIDVTVAGHVDEVSWMVRACNNLEPVYKLKPIAKKYLRIKTDDMDELHQATVRARRAAKKLGWSRHDDVEADYWMVRTLCAHDPVEADRLKLDPGLCERYAVRDAERTLKLGELFEYGMDDLGVRDVYEAELELLPVTMDMERRGVTVDMGVIERLQAECTAIVEGDMDAMNEAYQPDDGACFSPSSPAQVRALLFGGRPLKLDVVERTPTGLASTKASAVFSHKADPIVRHLLSWRCNDKALSSFFNKYTALATDRRVASDGRTLATVHPGYNQWGTLTGRYSCTEPNLQAVSDPQNSNSPAREFVVDVRQGFVPDDGTVWYAPDYDQVEVVIFADQTKCQTMLDAIASGQDVHTATTNRIWGGEGNDKGLAAMLDTLEATVGRRDPGEARALLERYGWDIVKAEASVGAKNSRKKGKSGTFTKIFSGGPAALMGWLNCSYAEAVQVLNDYDSAFPDMQESMRMMERTALSQGYLVNAYGRRLNVDRQYAYRATNHVVQSTAADLMKRGMRKCAAYLRDLDIGARIVMTVHDELIFSFYKNTVTKPRLRTLLQEMSDHGGALGVPISVGLDKISTRWSEKVKVSL